MLLRKQIGGFKQKQYDKETERSINTQIKRIEKNKQQIKNKKRKDGIDNQSKKIDELCLNLENYKLERNETRSKFIKLMSERDEINIQKITNHKQSIETRFRTNIKPTETHFKDKGFCKRNIQKSVIHKYQTR